MSFSTQSLFDGVAAAAAVAADSLRIFVQICADALQSAYTILLTFLWSFLLLLLLNISIWCCFGRSHDLRMGTIEMEKTGYILLCSCVFMFKFTISKNTSNVLCTKKMKMIKEREREAE